MKLEFRLLDEPAKTASDPVSPKPSAARSRLAEAAQHPLVRRAAELFKAQPVGVEEGKPLEAKAPGA